MTHFSTQQIAKEYLLLIADLCSFHVDNMMADYLNIPPLQSLLYFIILSITFKEFDLFLVSFKLVKI